MELRTSHTKCKNNRDFFCHICARLLTVQKQLIFSDYLKTCYINCFGFPPCFGRFTPTYLCVSCSSGLNRNNKSVSRKFYTQPAIWQDPNDPSDCFFCCANITGFKYKDRDKITYPSVSSVTPACYEPAVESEVASDIRNDVDDWADDILNDSDYLSDDDDCKKPILFDQGALDDLQKDLGLSKVGSELLASRLLERNLLDKSARVTASRKRSERFKYYFARDDDLTWCHDIPGLFQEIGAVYNPDHWRLFIDSSVKSLKGVLVHNGNNLPSIPVAYSTTLAESYDSMQLILVRIKYDMHQWLIGCDLKVVGFLMGLQKGNTKFPCFICLFDSQDRSHHYVKHNWLVRGTAIPGQHNIINHPLVSRDKILIPPLHLKLGAVKQFVTRLLKINPSAMETLKQVFPKKTNAKLKAGQFDGPQLRHLRASSNFTAIMSPDELHAWTCFCDLCDKFLGNNKDPNYVEIVHHFLAAYHTIGALMSVKLHFLESHLNWFPSNLGAFSDEQGERAHQDMKQIEQRYTGKDPVAFLAEFCWHLYRRSDEQHKHKARRKINYFKQITLNKLF